MLTLTSLFCVTLAYIFYATIEGEREAMYYHQKLLAGNIEKNWGEHALFTWQRTFVAAIIMNALAWNTGLTEIELTACLIAYPFMFMFLHDSAYYAKINKLSPGTYPGGWFNQSNTSQAVVDRKGLSTPWIRIALFFTGAILMAAVFINQIQNIQG